jgi:hypothetical protein
MTGTPLPIVAHGPLLVRITGTLGEVIHGEGAKVVTAPVNREGYIQRLRYWCSSTAFARLVRIKIQAEGSQPWLITPMGNVDDLGVVLWVGRGQKLVVGLERGEDVDPALVPALADPETWRLEAFG